MAEYLKFAEQLEAVSSVWRLGPSCTLRQASTLGCSWPATCQLMSNEINFISTSKFHCVH